MQVGVDKFIGDKLQEAIDFRQISKKKIAENIEVSPSNITKYIQGTLKPSPLVFEKIAFSLQFPKSFFLSEWDQNTFDNPALWRSFKSATQRARKKGVIVLKWQISLYSKFQNYFSELPRFTIPNITVPEDFQNITSEFIDEYCLNLRDTWGLGESPIKNLTRVLENRGFVLCSYDLNNPKLDAVSLVQSDVPYILINSQVTSSSRMRFNIAHELGHILLHRNVTEDDLEDESKFDHIEEQAHYFATSLLLPEKALSYDFWAPTLKCLEGIKLKWNVSMQAIMRRCLELGLITSSQFSYLNIAISKKRWRQNEPLDDIIPFEKPLIFNLAVSRLQDRFNLTGADLCVQTGLPSSVMSQLTQTHESKIDSEESTVNNVISLL